MTAYTRVSGAWKTVSAAYFKMSGVWKNVDAMSVRVPWPLRYAAAWLKPGYLTHPAFWASPYGFALPTRTVEAGKMRLVWAAAALGTSKGRCGSEITVFGQQSFTVSVTCTDAPAGVTWRALAGSLLGNDVVGPGTSTVSGILYNQLAQYSTTVICGLECESNAQGTTGFLVSAVTVTPNWALATVVPNPAVPVTPWKQVHPTPGVGTLKIVGVRKEKATESYGYFYPTTFRFNDKDGHWGNGDWNYPAVPYWIVAGDTSQVASCKVTLRFTPIAPKSPVEHTISWDAPVGWGLYHIAYMSADGYQQYYYCALTDAEAAAVRADTTKLITTMWTPKQGGHFVWMPVCWDASGVTFPMSTETAGQSGVGTDAYSGTGNFPPNRTATSALADYTVANGYSDMGNYSIVYSAITIELKNSGGTVIASWTGSLPAGRTVDSPGLGSAPVAAMRGAARMVQPLEFYWPEEWRGLFDQVDTLYPVYSVRWGRDIPNKGEGEWDVFDVDGTKIGDFRLAMRYGSPGIIEIRGVNLAPDLVGMKIMRHIVEHGVTYCPTEDVIITPPDEITYQVMQSWGWQEMTTLSPLSLAALPREYQENLKRSLFIRSDPMYSLFPLLGFPTWPEVTRD
jgi:hypothetical protein